MSSFLDHSLRRNAIVKWAMKLEHFIWIRLWRWLRLRAMVTSQLVSACLFYLNTHVNIRALSHYIFMSELKASAPRVRSQIASRIRPLYFLFIRFGIAERFRKKILRVSLKLDFLKFGVRVISLIVTTSNFLYQSYNQLFK